MGLVRDVDPPLTALQMPCTSGCPSGRCSGGHGLGATAWFPAPPPPCPTTGTTADRNAALIPRATIARSILIWGLQFPSFGGSSFGIRVVFLEVKAIAFIV